MHAAYAKSFHDGSLVSFLESQRQWIRDKGPMVESNIGFIETYRDPAGIRGEWEGVIPFLEQKIPKEEDKQDGSLIHDSVTADDIAAVVSRITGIPVSKLTSGHIQKLVHMEDALQASVRGQDEAIKAVSNAVRLQRAGLSGDNRPLASFFFLGPTGVGKTELCKKLAGFLFSTESAVVRFDMSEFQEKHTISRLIGAPSGYVGYEDAGQLTEA
ncbi:hypothetical protein BN1708_017143, partial [Verticillium longisporum]